ncbi:MAG: hypothetical protein LLG42_12295 [Chloroflexi bacterium]|nr:hypothetical protein [Chloroflexota bacterium]
MSTNQTALELGRLLRSGTAGCVVGCRVNQMSAPEFGGMVRIPIDGPQDLQIYGLIYDIHIDDDGLVRQLITAERVEESTIQDNRVNRNVPVEISVLFIGYTQIRKVYHLLPPRPPLTLDRIFTCTPAELREFTSAGRFGYLRHILRTENIPTGELLAAHLQMAAREHHQAGNPGWAGSATRELITLLRDDYPSLMGVLGALADTDIQFRKEES